MDMHVHQGEHSHTIASGQWEGSAEGIAYSEFNHALAGLGVILVGLTELRTAMGWTALAWSRWLLPAALVGSGIFLLIWSDHEAWPIGLLQWAWSTLLPGFALIGGGMLFLHMHGPHPSGHQIQIHHNVMGTLALLGGLAWFAGEWLHRPVQTAPTPHTQESRSVLKILWAVVVIIIGVQLLVYSES
jgi:putative copper resistance protein D